MEFYTMSKYENINDRMKRLANQGTVSTLQRQHQSFTGQHDRSISYKMSSGQKDYVNQSFPVLQNPYEDCGLGYSEQQANTKKVQDKYHAINHSKKLFTHKPKNFNRSVEILDMADIQGQEKVTSGKYIQKQVQGSSKMLNKLKSDQTIKIQNILESYSNYKNNKEKFLQTINRDTKKSEEISQLQFNRNEQEVGKKEERHQKMFEPIENIWENAKNDNKMIRIDDVKQKYVKNKQRSHILSKYMKTSQDQGVQQATQVTFMEKPRLIFKNIKINTHQNRQHVQKPLLGGMLSPRAPGRIVKNLQRGIAVNL